MDCPPQADTVTEEELDDLQHRVCAVNTVAQIVRTEYASVDLKKVLQLCRPSDRVIAPRGGDSLAYGHRASHAGLGRQDGTISICFDFTEGSGHAEEGGSEESAGAERVYVVNCSLELARFQKWLRAVVEEHHQNLFRVKGVLAIEDSAARLVVGT